MKKVLIFGLLVVISLSFAVSMNAAESNDILNLAESLIANGYPSSEFTNLTDKYNAAKGDQSAGNMTALENATNAFLDSLYTPSTSYPLTEKIFEDFSDAEAISPQISFDGAKRIVGGKYETNWATALEMYLKKGYDNVKYEFDLTVKSGLHGFFALRVTPGVKSNMYGGGRSNKGENNSGNGLSFDVVNALHPNSIAIGFNDGKFNQAPIVAVPYPAGFSPQSNNSYIVYDYGNVITVTINGTKFCHLVFEKNSLSKYSNCKVYNADGTLVGAVENCGTYKKGGFSTGSRTATTTIDNLRISTLGGMFDIIDMQVLAENIAIAKAKTDIGYVAITWHRLQDAITNAEEILGKDLIDLTVAEVNEATSNLINAINKLTIIEDITDLKGKLLLNKATSEQFIKVIPSSSVNDTHLVLQHTGTLGEGGFILMFNAESAGTKTVNIHYDAAHPATNYPNLLIYVYENDSEAIHYTMPSNGNGTWGRYQDYEIEIDVQKGENEIYFASATNPQGLTINIDYIEIGKLVPSATPEPTSEPTSEPTTDNPTTGDIFPLLGLTVLAVASALFILKKRKTIK